MHKGAKRQVVLCNGVTLREIFRLASCQVQRTWTSAMHCLRDKGAFGPYLEQRLSTRGRQEALYLEYSLATSR